MVCANVCAWICHIGGAWTRTSEHCCCGSRRSWFPRCMSQEIKWDECLVWFLSGKSFNLCFSCVGCSALLLVLFYWGLLCFCLPCKQALGRTCLMQKRKRKKTLMWEPLGLRGCSTCIINASTGPIAHWWEHSIFFPFPFPSPSSTHTLRISTESLFSLYLSPVTFSPRFLQHELYFPLTGSVSGGVWTEHSL